MASLHSFNHASSLAGALVLKPQSVSEPAPVLDLPALQTASTILQDKLNKDASAVPDLGEMLTIRECEFNESRQEKLIL
jgi:hypothetical protein